VLARRRGLASGLTKQPVRPRNHFPAVDKTLLRAFHQFGVNFAQPSDTQQGLANRFCRSLVCPLKAAVRSVDWIVLAGNGRRNSAIEPWAYFGGRWSVCLPFSTGSTGESHPCEKCHRATGPNPKKALSPALLAVAKKLLMLWPRSHGKPTRSI